MVASTIPATAATKTVRTSPALFAKDGLRLYDKWFVECTLFRFRRVFMLFSCLAALQFFRLSNKKGAGQPRKHVFPLETKFQYTTFTKKAALEFALNLFFATKTKTETEMAPLKNQLSQLSQVGLVDFRSGQVSLDKLTYPT